MVAFGESVRDTPQDKATAQLLLTFTIKDPYNGPIPQPRDCNKANGAKESGGGGGGEREEEEEEVDGGGDSAAAASPSNLLCHTHTHTAHTHCTHVTSPQP